MINLLNVNINIFIKNNYFSQKIFNEKSNIALHFCKSLLYDLTEESWALVSAAAFNLLQFVVWLKYAKCKSYKSVVPYAKLTHTPGTL